MKINLHYCQFYFVNSLGLVIDMFESITTGVSEESLNCSFSVAICPGYLSIFAAGNHIDFTYPNLSSMLSSEGIVELQNDP